MKELIVHIGMHKTGTTSIQSSLNRFDNGKIRYARLSDVNHSIPVYTQFSNQRHQYHIHTTRGLSPSDIDAKVVEFRRDLDKELTQDRHTLILSGEDISLLESDSVKALKEYLTPHAERIRIVAYVRDPAAFASSALQQYIRGGHGQASIPSPEYTNRFKAFVDHFGVDSVEFIRFDKDTLRGGSAVQDFCHLVGIDPSEINERRGNESTTLECAQMIYHFNRFGLPSAGSPLLTKVRGQFLHRLSSCFTGSGFKIPQDWVTAHIDTADVAWLQSVSDLQFMGSEQLQNAHTNRSEDANKDYIEDLHNMLATIDRENVQKLKEEVAKIDSHIATSDDVTSLLNFLYTSILLDTKSKDQSLISPAVEGAKRAYGRLKPTRAA